MLLLSKKKGKILKQLLTIERKEMRVSERGQGPNSGQRRTRHQGAAALLFLLAEARANEKHQQQGLLSYYVVTR